MKSYFNVLTEKCYFQNYFQNEPPHLDLCFFPLQSLNSHCDIALEKLLFFNFANINFVICFWEL